MKIYLYLMDRIMMFKLPNEVSGSFSFDPSEEDDSKLINIEARKGQWVLYSTNDSKIMNSNIEVDSTIIEPNSYYIIKKNDKNYLIYISSLLNNKIETYQYDNNINLLIGNDNTCNIQYNCNLFKGSIAKIHSENGKLLLDISNNFVVYINNKALTNTQYIINNGDQINIYALKIMILPKLLLINNPNNKVIINEVNSNIHKYQYPTPDRPQNIEVKDIDLYTKDDYFSKSPRIRRIIENKEIKLSPPPKSNDNQELPLILTIGPMLTMGTMATVNLINTMSRIGAKETTLKDSWPSLVTSGAMLLSMLLWPTLTRLYNKKMKKKKREELIKKYGEYLQEKKQELAIETKLQREILIENLITTEECLNIINRKGFNFWNKRVDQDDFLVVRIGVGNELLDAKVNYPEERFTIEEDELRKQADAMVEEYKYIENVPIGYSFKENKVTAIMGNSYKSHNFINNIILQFLAFYSYEDIKLVIFTSKNNESYFDYIKYLNHNFTNDKSLRFFATNIETSKNVAEYLSFEVSSRKAKARNKDNFPKPHYIIIIDNYDMVKRYDFVNDITESDDELGFSIIILEERLSKLPSKCSNFISLGVNNKGGILKNSYEKQEQTIFYDEINYNIDMMSITQKLSNIPIEFEDGLKNLPDAISFMEMERVGKVEQLNILNRWNINDSTTSLKAEVGVDEQGDLMYLDLHEKYHGPHGLIAGTTGSGKSEFIITYILSMCINYSPDDVSFILIDYKGGGLALAFENKVTGISLPHLAGTITNLDKAEMNRTLVSIDSEVKKRQHMFNVARDTLGESTIDIYKYQRFYKEGRLSEPIPHLFIICDEFAELKSQQPEFMDNLISVARIGRSLGVHLILATQKPSGVVNDQIWSNSKFKVCLKVQDESDSKEMLKKPDAAYLKQAGRFYLQVGYDEYYALGQSGWCGAKYYPSDKIVKQVDKSLNFINDCGMYIKSIQAGTGTKIEAQGEQIAAIMKLIIEVANKSNKKARKLWLDNIEDIITVEYLENKYNITKTPYQPKTIIGEYDAPEKQTQGMILYDYLTDGNTLIYGNDGSEREMLLNTLIYSTSKNYTPEEINFYIIDYGSESLRRYQGLPHIGGIVFQGEDEKYNNLLKLIRNELQTRKKIFADYGGEYNNYIKSSQNKLPVKVVIFNNYDSIYESNQSLYDTLPELVRDSERYGIIFILTGNATNSIHSKVSQNFKNIYAYKLKDVSDYSTILGSRTKNPPKENPGRGLLNNDGIHEFQTASIIDNSDELNDYLIEFINKQKELCTTHAKRIPTLPDIVRADDIKEEISTLNNVPIGISKNSLDILTVDYLSNLGNIITSNKLANTKNFILSLLSIIRILNNTNLFILDPIKQLMLDIKNYPNYYNNNLEEILDKINEYIKSLIDKKSQDQGVILIYGLDKFITKIDKKKFEELSTNIKKYEHISLIVVDDASKLKNYAYESWFSSIFSTSDGVWIGKGVSEQNILRLSNINREMTKEIKNNMGYLINEGSGTLCKLIDFITKESDDKNE